MTNRTIDARVRTPLVVTFAAGTTGAWHVERIEAVRGEGLAPAERLAMLEGAAARVPSSTAWLLRGATSHIRYTNRGELQALEAGQSALGRSEVTQAALIPVRKTDEWWNFAQDLRRAIFEERSRHISTGLQYLPAIARRLHHCRDLGEAFDSLTRFEYAPEHAAAFEELVNRLRKTEEWTYVEREVDIRLTLSRHTT